MTALASKLDPRTLDFAPSLLALQERPPSPLPRTVLTLLVLLLTTLIAWSCYGQLDIIAVTEGKLVPKTYVKIVQPAEGGILKEILVNEGDAVTEGQILMRMDRQLAEADTRILDDGIAQRTLQLARIDAELSDRPFSVVPAKAGTQSNNFIPFPSTADGHRDGEQHIPSPLIGKGERGGATVAQASAHALDATHTRSRPQDGGATADPSSPRRRGSSETNTSFSASLIQQVAAQYHARRRSYQDALAEEQAALRKAKEDLAAAQQVKEKLAALLPTYQQEEAALAKLGEKHLAAELDVIERGRKRIETEGDLKTQGSTVESLKASITQSEQRLNQIASRYQEQLQNERVEAQAQLDKLKQEHAKQEHRNTLLELKAPQNGIVKDVATHTLGAVVSPGTVLMTLVPSNELLQAEVMVKNEDIGFVNEGQPAKIKLVAYPFQKYGLVEGKVIHVSADANDTPQSTENDTNTRDETGKQSALRYKAIVQLDAQALEKQGKRFKLSPGMQVVAEIDQGKRTVLEYLLSPVQKTVFEAGRER